MIALFAALMIGGAAALLGYGLLVRTRRERNTLAEMIEQTPAQVRRFVELERAATEAVGARGWGRRLAHDLPHAGITISPGAYAIVVACGCGSGGLLAAAAFGPLAGIVTAGVGFATVQMFVRRRARKWLLRFEDELPDALDLCAGSLEAGASLAQAMELVAADGRPPLAEELSRALAESRLGEPIAEALERTAERTGSREFGWVVRGVRAQQEYGASLADLLRTAASTLRERAELKREVRALTAEGRISAYVLIALPFGVGGFFSLANPGYLGTLFASAAGWSLVAFASLLMCVGTLWMRRIVRVEV